MKSSILSVLLKEKSSSIPIWYMRQAGRYLPEYLKLREQESNFIRFCLTPELCIEAACQPLRRFNLDASIVFADILLIPYMLGQSVHFEKGVGPLLGKIDFPHFLDRLEVKAERLNPVYETISGLKKQLTPAQALIGFSGGVWTLACYMLAGRSEANQETARTFMFREREYFSQLIDILTEQVGNYLIKQIDAGADIIQIFDSWAGVLAQAEFEQYVIEPTARLVKKIRAHAPDVPIIGFPRGCGVLAKSYVEQTGVSALSVDGNHSFAFLKEIQKQVPVQGNLDPMLAVVGGAPMFAQAKKIIEELREGGLIFGLSHGIVPQTPPENIAALTEFIRTECNG